jgi:hypothetical protein
VTVRGIEMLSSENFFASRGAGVTGRGTTDVGLFSETWRSSVSGSATVLIRAGGSTAKRKKDMTARVGDRNRGRANLNDTTTIIISRETGKVR